MPAITADPQTLPRIAVPADATPRSVRAVTTAVAGLEGEGFPVRRAFAGVAAHDLDPFILMDQMGEIEYGPGEPKGTPWHPHRGFETVTYIIDGSFIHQDSHGGGGVLSDGDTQWMTAGRGILHIETPPESLVRSGGRFHGVQIWVNLPAADKMIEPRYQHIAGNEVTLVASDDGASLVRLIAGELGTHQGPGSTHSPITLVHVTVAPGHQVTLPWSSDHNALVYALKGTGSVGASAAPIRTGQLAQLIDGDAIVVAADPADEPLEVLVLGGRPIGEPVVQYGPFVMNTRAEIQQAIEDFNAGRMGTIPSEAIQPHRM